MNSTTNGTATFPGNLANLTQIANVTFVEATLVIQLSDGRAIQLELARYSWLRWLLKATPEQRSRWEIVPTGGGVWWPDLDDGIELRPLLDMQSLR